ncbi:MAG: hypothetical protein AAGF87_12680 [Bacteroidota bacterium]
MPDALDPVNKVVLLLATGPSVKDILDYRPSIAEEERFTALTRKKRSGELSQTEKEEIRSFELAEHMIRMAKLHAAKQRA